MAKLTKAQRAELREKFDGRCAYCGCPLPQKGWHADHVEAVYRKLEIDEEARAKGKWKLKQTGEVYRPENDSLENLFPACAPCNLFKSTFSVEAFREQIAAQAERARQYSVNFRTAERFGLVTVVNVPVVFWFERAEAQEKAS
ncbi:HNH endonuclease [Serratia quinivorans]|uniref:HNH endonuclease n=1 Tax=Serratia quinivorans TaxID=137545 RepID=UPI00217A15F0|nr:HNH endonuclease signature motif containing protein [Serratia quinivorans]CAI1817728.1 HNH endonuclease [Serratia quinivorans]